MRRDELYSQLKKARSDNQHEGLVREGGVRRRNVRQERLDKRSAPIRELAERNRNCVARAKDVRSRLGEDIEMYDSSKALIVIDMSMNSSEYTAACISSRPHKHLQHNPFRESKKENTSIALVALTPKQFLQVRQDPWHFKDSYLESASSDSVLELISDRSVMARFFGVSQPRSTPLEYIDEIELGETDSLGIGYDSIMKDAGGMLDTKRFNPNRAIKRGIYLRLTESMVERAEMILDMVEEALGDEELNPELARLMRGGSTSIT